MAPIDDGRIGQREVGVTIHDIHEPRQLGVHDVGFYDTRCAVTILWNTNRK